jgi:hypothetical protein
MIPQIIQICIVAIVLLSQAVLDGKPRTGNHHFATSFVFILLGQLLLLWGGFYAPFFK